MKGLVHWFAENNVAANLLMIIIIVGGLQAIPQLDKEFFPQPHLNTIIATVTYPGASPSEVEQQICLRIEEALDGLDGIQETVCIANEGYGNMRVKVDYGYDTSSVLNDVKSRIDAITTFPSETERPQVRQQLWQSRIINVVLYGDVEERALKELGLQLKDELSALSRIQKVEFKYPRDYEVSVEVSKVNLSRYGITFDQVAQAIRMYSLNLPAGKLRTRDGDIQLQTRSQAYDFNDFSNIVLLRSDNGAKVTLGDVAKIEDDFIEDRWSTRINGFPGYSLDVYITQNPNIIATSEAVRKFVDKRRASLPKGVSMDVWLDMNVPYEGRITTLLKNGIGGLLLVFIVLLLFLRPILAMWVVIGILVAFFGAFWFLPMTGTSLNIISLFAFLLVLGILVDDAIIVGESVYSSQERGEVGLEAAVAGTTTVIKPVFFAVVTTMVFFGSLLFMPEFVREPQAIAWVVIISLVFSLIECLFILPSHLAQMRPERQPTWLLTRSLYWLRSKCHNGLKGFISNIYQPFLKRCMDAKMITQTVFVVALLLPTIYWSSGWIQTTGFPIVQADFLMVRVELPEGTPFEQVDELANHIERSMGSVKETLNKGEIPYAGIVQRSAYSNNVFALMEIINFDDIPYSNETILAMLSERIGKLPQAKDLQLRAEIFNRGKPISIEIRAASVEAIQVATQELRTLLGGYEDIFNIRDSLDNPRTELALSLKPLAETMNITVASLAKQVRQAFYGEEAQRIPRAREDVRVMVRYPIEERRSLANILNMWVRSPDGREVPFRTVADVKFQDSYTKIERVDGKRKSTLTADAQPTAPIQEIMRKVYTQLVPKLRKQYADIRIAPSGFQKEEAETFDRIPLLLMLSTLIIFAIMAIAFRSYWQPLLIVIAIPYGIVGSVIGHLIVGREMSMFSLMGIIACAGVVVNDNLVLINKINILREEGKAIYDAIVEAACDRFRAIMLTSLTTFIGLLPIMLERSVQAQFLIPTVISLAFGVFFATFVTLLYVPCFYLSLESFQNRLHRFKKRVQRLFSSSKAV